MFALLTQYGDLEFFLPTVTAACCQPCWARVHAGTAFTPCSCRRIPRKYTFCTIQAEACAAACLQIGIGYRKNNVSKASGDYRTGAACPRHGWKAATRAGPVVVAVRAMEPAAPFAASTAAPASCAFAAAHDTPYETFNEISTRALDDLEQAKRNFMEFLLSADVWGEMQVGHSACVDCYRCCYRRMRGV